MSPSFLLHSPSLLPTANLAFHLNDQEKAVWLFFFFSFFILFCFNEIQSWGRQKYSPSPESHGWLSGTGSSSYSTRLV